MKFLILGLSLGLVFTACAMGGKSTRLKSEVDISKLPWEWCTPEMISKEGEPDFHKGKLCLVECTEKLKRNGSCKHDKYKYPWKDAKEDHDFFMNKYLNVPESEYYK